MDIQDSFHLKLAEKHLEKMPLFLFCAIIFTTCKQGKKLTSIWPFEMRFSQRTQVQ